MGSSESTVDDRGIPAVTIAVLAVLAATPPVATDLYLASFPQMAAGLHTDSQHIQLTLTAFLAGLGLGQLLWGPLSDHVGRWWPLLVGTTVASVASLVTVLAPNVDVLIGARFLQALAASSSLVIARAMIADLARGHRAAHALSLMMTMITIAPIAAPVLGGLLAGQVPWRGVLAIILGFVVLQLVGIVTVLRETLPASARTPRLSYAPLGALLRRRTFAAYGLTVAFCFGCLMSYVSMSSFVYQSVLDLPSWAFGVGFGVNSIALMAAGATSTRLARRRVHPATTIRRALPVLVGGSTLVLLAALSPWPSLLLAPLFVTVGSFGFISGNTTALAMEQARDHRGAGSAFLGSLQFVTGGLFSMVGGLTGEGTAIPMGACMVVGALGCALCFTLARRSLDPASEAAFSTR